MGTLVGLARKMRCTWHLVLLVSAAVATAEGAPITEHNVQVNLGEEATIGSQPMHSADQMGRLLRIKDAVEALSSPVPLGGEAPSGVRSLGESTPEEKQQADMRKRPGVDSDLISLDHLLDRFESVGEKMDEAGDNLGEAASANSKLVKNEVLHKLMNIQGDRDSAEAVKRVVAFLKNGLKAGLALSRAELDEV